MTPKKILDFLKEKGYGVGEFLGQGSQGSAFVLGSDHNKVLKITRDYKEAQASFFILESKRKLKNVVKIFDVFGFEAEKHVGGKILYAIIQERLSRLAEDEEGFIQGIRQSTQFKNVDTRNAKKFDIVEFLQQKVVLSLLGWHPTVGIEDAQKILIDIVNGLKELNSLNIYFKDTMASNIMYDLTTDEYKIIDVGYSDVFGHARLRILETKIMDSIQIARFK